MSAVYPLLAHPQLLELTPLLANIYILHSRQAVLDGLTPIAKGALPIPGGAMTGIALSDLSRLNQLDPIDDSRPLVTVLATAELLARGDRDAHHLITRNLRAVRDRYAAEADWGGRLRAPRSLHPEATLTGPGLASPDSPWSHGDLDLLERIGAYLSKHPDAAGTLGMADLVAPDSALASAGFEGIRSGRSWVLPGFVRTLTQRVEHVARIHTDGTWGTAWMITPELAVSCHHVLNGGRAGPLATKLLQKRGDTVRLHFADEPPVDGLERPDVVGATVEAALWGPPELDFVILRLPTPRNGCLPVSRAPLSLGPGDSFLPANIPQYPNGGGLQIGIRENLITHADQTYITYTTDTQPGSSGAPVCDDRWVVRALHRRNGNVGVQSSAILGCLEDSKPALFAELQQYGDLRD